MSGEKPARTAGQRGPHRISPPTITALLRFPSRTARKSQLRKSPWGQEREQPSEGGGVSASSSRLEKGYTVTVGPKPDEGYTDAAITFTEYPCIFSRTLCNARLSTVIRACLKIVNTPDRRAFFCRAALLCLARRKNSLPLGILPIFKRRLRQGTEFRSKSRPVNQQQTLSPPASSCPPCPQGIRRSRSPIGKTACWN